MARRREKYNKYHREYQRKRYHRRRDSAIKQLGGQCVICQSTKNLEIDHIDRTKKSYKVSNLGGLSERKLQSELKKCQLLCRDCHSKKTILETGRKLAKGNHGTVSTYRYCRCKECKRAKRDYFQEYRAKKKKSCS